MNDGLKVQEFHPDRYRQEVSGGSSRAVICEKLSDLLEEACPWLISFTAASSLLMAFFAA